MYVAPPYPQGGNSCIATQQTWCVWTSVAHYTLPVWPPGLCVVTTPLNIAAWQMELSAHPDQALGQYITDGLRHGFQIGFRRGSPLKSTSSNLQSAPSHPEAVNDFVRKELSLGRLLGP